MFGFRLKFLFKVVLIKKFFNNYRLRFFSAAFLFLGSSLTATPLGIINNLRGDYEKNIFPILAIFIFSSSVIAQSLTKQDLLEFYPNNIGNSWSYRWLYYHVIEDFYEAGTDKIFISADTLINNTKFWKVEYNFGTYNYENYFERIDTEPGM